MLHRTVDHREMACCMLTQIVNSLTAKMEIGAPMAAMYLLGNPDHYTDHKFCTFYWRSYVHEARCPWQMDTNSVKYDKVVIRNRNGRLTAVTPVQDYTFRLVKFDQVTLYDWIHLHNKKSRPRCNLKSELKKKQKTNCTAISSICSSSDSAMDSRVESTSPHFVGGGCSVFSSHGDMGEIWKETMNLGMKHSINLHLIYISRSSWNSSTSDTNA